jgi:hypothetical protein
MNRLLKTILIGILVILIVLAIYLLHNKQIINTNIQNNSNQTFYTRYSGCTTPMTIDQMKATGHGVYFSSKEDCLTYTDPVGYQSIVGQG